MVKAALKLSFWFVIGAGSIVALLGNISLHTPWKYTVHSTIPAGTEITIVGPNGEPMTIQVPEGQTISGNKTFDVGAPLTLISIYLIGSAVTYGLKRRRPACTGP